MVAAVILPVVAVLLAVALLGRSYVANNLADNPWAVAITGVKHSGGEMAYDPSGGRLDALGETLSKVGDHVIGIGMVDGNVEGVEQSGTAPILWLLWTGIPGLILLLGREAILFSAARSALRLGAPALALTQALVAVMGQELSYGTWMYPNYLTLAAMVVVVGSVAAQRPAARDGHQPVLRPLMQ
jgi:hypothetical protein